MASKWLLVNNEDEWEDAFKKLCDHIGNTNVVGLDCEWAEVNNWRRLYESKDVLEANRNRDDQELAKLDQIRLTNARLDRVASLQLAAWDGFSVLIRLILFERAPKSLHSFLVDGRMVKVGVNIFVDCNRLYRDWGLLVNSWLDLRFLFKDLPNIGVTSVNDSLRNGLKALGDLYCDTTERYSQSIRFSNWCGRQLTPDQLEYATQDARIAVETFANLGSEHLKVLTGRKHLENRNGEFWKMLNKYARVYLNSKFDSDRYMSLKMGGDGGKRKKHKEEVEDSTSDLDLDLEALNEVCTSRDAVHFYPNLAQENDEIEEEPFAAISPLLLNLAEKDGNGKKPEPIEVEFEKNGKIYRFKCTKN